VHACLFLSLDIFLRGLIQGREEKVVAILPWRPFHFGLPCNCILPLSQSLPPFSFSHKSVAHTTKKSNNKQGTQNAPPCLSPCTSSTYLERRVYVIVIIPTARTRSQQPRSLSLSLNLSLVLVCDTVYHSAVVQVTTAVLYLVPPLRLFPLLTFFLSLTSLRSFLFNHHRPSLFSSTPSFFSLALATPFKS